MCFQGMRKQRARFYMTHTIRPATLADFPIIYSLFQDVLEEGSTYSYTPEEMTADRSLAYWISGESTHCFVAEVDGKVAGVCAIRPNRTGRADHVANASFMVDKLYRRLGIAKALCSHAIDTAVILGYKAMQFNFVVSTNEVALKLWQSLGFDIIGTLPKGYRHKEHGLVDVYIMHKFL